MGRRWGAGAPRQGAGGLEIRALAKTAALWAEFPWAWWDLAGLGEEDP